MLGVMCNVRVLWLLFWCILKCESSLASICWWFAIWMASIFSCTPFHLKLQLSQRKLVYTGLVYVWGTHILTSLSPLMKYLLMCRNRGTLSFLCTHTLYNGHQVQIKHKCALIYQTWTRLAWRNSSLLKPSLKILVTFSHNIIIIVWMGKLVEIVPFLFKYVGSRFHKCELGFNSICTLIVPFSSAWKHVFVNRKPTSTTSVIKWFLRSFLVCFIFLSSLRPTWMRSLSPEPFPPWGSRWSMCASYATRWRGKN